MGIGAFGLSEGRGMLFFSSPLKTGHRADRPIQIRNHDERLDSLKLHIASLGSAISMVLGANFCTTKTRS